MEKFLDEIGKNKEPTWLKEFRLSELKAYENSRAESTELFKHQTFFNDFSFDDYKDGSSDDFDLELSPDSVYAIQKGNDIEINVPEKFKESGIVIAGLDEFKENPQLKQIFISNSKIDDKFLHLNSALFRSGLYVYIPKGMVVKEPFRFITSVNSNIISKIIFVLESESKLKVVKEDYSRPSSDRLLFSDSIEVLLRDDAELQLSHLQNLSQNVVHLSNKVTTCHKDSKIYWNIGYFGGLKVRSRVYSMLLGEGSEVEDLEVLFGNNEQKFDVYSNLIHTGKNTIGRVVSNGVLKDKATSLLKGMIKISENAKNTNSFLAQHGMLLNRDAKAKAIPGLEIETNEVKATHSASVSQIEDDKIFYLMSRGLSEQDAKKLIAFGFFEPVIQRMFLDEIKVKLRHLLELKWNGKEDEFLDNYGKYKFEEPEQAKKKDDMFAGHYKYR